MRVEHAVIQVHAPPASRPPLAQPRQRWARGGQYVDLFDHAENTPTLATFQCIDFEGTDATPHGADRLAGTYGLFCRASARASRGFWARVSGHYEGIRLRDGDA